MESEHELATEVVFAVIFVNGKTAQFVIAMSIRDDRRSSGGANCPNRLKRGEEAEQEMLSCLV